MFSYSKSKWKKRHKNNHLTSEIKKESATSNDKSFIYNLQEHFDRVHYYLHNQNADQKISIRDFVFTFGCFTRQIWKWVI